MVVLGQRLVLCQGRGLLCQRPTSQVAVGAGARQAARLDGGARGAGRGFLAHGAAAGLREAARLEWTGLRQL